MHEPREDYFRHGLVIHRGHSPIPLNEAAQPRPVLHVCGSVEAAGVTKGGQLGRCRLSAECLQGRVYAETEGEEERDDRD